jgi:hypothetical protein
MWYRTWKKTFTSQHILQHWYPCPIALPMRRNPQHRSILIVVSTASAPPFQPLHHQRNVSLVSWPSCEPLYPTNTSYRKEEIFFQEYPLHWDLLLIKKYNGTMIFASTLKHGRHFDYWNEPLNMHMRFFCLDCHESGLCCYLVIHI